VATIDPRHAVAHGRAARSPFHGEDHSGAFVTAARPFSLDLEATPYAYVERANNALVYLVKKYLEKASSPASVLDVGCGCGGNARAIRDARPEVKLFGIEPNARAAELAAPVCEQVYHGEVEGWLKQANGQHFDVVVLADVLEHIAHPVAFLRALAAHPGLIDAYWIISVPNYAVWYNRISTLFGRFEYTWSGLRDRTHLRFYTRRSVQRLLRECGFSVLEDRCSPSLVQSAAPALRRLFDKDVSEGNHLALGESRAYRVYENAIEPLETAACQIWPELLGFQIVTVAKLGGA
jgi:SAM-dependent methyltransferase